MIDNGACDLGKYYSLTSQASTKTERPYMVIQRLRQPLCSSALPCSVLFHLWPSSSRLVRLLDIDTVSSYSGICYASYRYTLGYSLGLVMLFEAAFLVYGILHVYFGTRPFWIEYNLFRQKQIIISFHKMNSLYEP